MLFTEQKIIVHPLHPTLNVQVTSVGDEECLPWTLSRLKWLSPGSKVCDLNHPFSWELEWSQIFLQGRFWPSLHLLPQPVEMGCLSFYLALGHQPILGDSVSRKVPGQASIVEASSPSQTGLLWGTTGEIACRSYNQQPLCFPPPWKTGLLLAYGHCESCTDVVFLLAWGRQGSNLQLNIVTVQLLTYAILCSSLPIGFIILFP